MNLDFLPPEFRSPAAIAAAVAAGIGAVVLALGVAGSSGGSLGSSSGGGTPPSTTVPTTVTTTPTTEPTTTVPTTTTTPVDSANDFTVTASGVPGEVTLVVNGTAPGTSLINLNFEDGVVGYVLANKGQYQFSSYGPLDITTPTIEVELTYASCTPNWGECDTDTEQKFTRTVTVNYL